MYIPSPTALSTIAALPRSGKVADRILRSMERRRVRFMGSVIEPGVGRGWRRLTIFWIGGREDRLLIAPWGAVRRMRAAGLTGI
jgi:hypothetical protein